MYYLRVVKMVLNVTFNYWEEVDLCALLWVICIDSLHAAILDGMNLGAWALITHPAAQSVSPGMRSGWWRAQ